nr:hypothetical protein [Tanacetum cinerariifolium]
MTGEGPANMIARRVSDDLISFSGEISPLRYMRLFLVQKVDESPMKDQEEVHDSLLVAKDAKRGEEAKLVALNDVIVEALDEYGYDYVIYVMNVYIAATGITFWLCPMIDLCLDVGCGCYPPLRCCVWRYYYRLCWLLIIVDWCSHLVDCMLYYVGSVEGCSTARLQACVKLEGLGEQGNAVGAFENIKEIVSHDFVTLGLLEQLLARAQVGVDFKDGYLDDVEEKV